MTFRLSNLSHRIAGGIGAIKNPCAQRVLDLDIERLRGQWRQIGLRHTVRACYDKMGRSLARL